MRKAAKNELLSHLRAETLAWWQSVQAEFVLEPHHVRVLTLAAEAWDRCTQAREVIDSDGLTYTDRFGAPKARPEIAIERDSRLAFARLLREINLDTDEAPESRVPRRVG